ncbi:DNA double-strand break repair Rad50 ATPase, putative [Entamoeba dispar SAW760]|uniref:DNA double-strand break repair Rad50 ATPase, putative n=2 Tax=Entamoeba dispar (strain ATCC PRA-260 / SAW760) TaxID=370354 RepID=B0EMK9_ENTDS|nr:DNA double-strand break repair Rad50 ATPase, putative [Entamoeba dispar SAW760]EDR24255.1 DNA double-strand break repair Rad50 ATPase, putative [Entamoeba dispar SAW760]|eukprot:EDR24255.1 DNA double-strand break repair Rad50 ATPase, putative [Entamoeba dispar SAW760]
MKLLQLILCFMLIAQIFAEDVENTVSIEGEEFELEDDNKYEREKAQISEKMRSSIEKKIARKIALREVAKKRQFDRKTSKIHRKLKKINTQIEGLQKRLHIYSKTRKSLKIKRTKLTSQKKAAILKIKELRTSMQTKITKMEMKAMKKGKKINLTKKRALQLIQKNQARKIVREFTIKENRIKRQLKQLESKKSIMRRKIVHLQGVAKYLRAKLANVLKQKQEYAKKIQNKRIQLVKKAMKYAKVFAMLNQVEKHIKHVEERLSVLVDERKRGKLSSRREYLMKKQKMIKKRIEVLKRRKAERKARKLEINKMKQQMKEYNKKYHAEKKLKKAALRSAKRQVSYLKRQYKKAERAYNGARSLVKREKKAIALKGARLAFFQAKSAVYNLKKDIRDMKNISIQKVHAILRGLLKLKIIDANMRITEHKLSIKEYEVYKKKVVSRIQQLKKYGRRLDLCPANQRLLRKRLSINYRRLKHIARKISHSMKAIRIHQLRIGMMHKKLRMIAIKEYKHMKAMVRSLKASVKELKSTIRVAKFKKACAGVITRKRMNYIIKNAKNEIQSLKVEINDFRMKIKLVDEAIAEEKRQRLMVTKIDYHRAKAALHEAKHGIRVISRKIQKNKELATSSTEPWKRRQYLSRNGKLTMKLVKLESMRKKLAQKVDMLKVKYNKLYQAEISEFLAYKTKWEVRKSKVIGELNRLAKQDSKITKKLRKGICELKKCRILFSRKYNYLQAHKLQIVLYKINKKLEKIHSEYVRRSEARSFRIIKKRFNKQKKAYIKNEHLLKHVRHQLTRLEKKIAVAEQRLPFLADNEKVIARGVVAALEKIKRNVQKKIKVLENQKTIIMKKYLALNKEYLIQLKKRMESDKKRKGELIAKRPETLRAALYELIPHKQQRAERKLNRLDKELESLEKRSLEDAHRMKEAIRTRKFLQEAVKPKVVCTGGIINCRYCHSLGRILKVSLRNREEDRIILERLHHRCNKELPENQARCIDVAMRLTEVAVKVFDPVKFRVASACKKIGVCGI